MLYKAMSSFLIVLLHLFFLVQAKGDGKFIGTNSYLAFTDGRSALAGAEDKIAIKFRFCNARGILLYLGGTNGFFAMGISNGKIYLEWKTNHKLVEVYLLRFILKSP